MHTKRNTGRNHAHPEIGVRERARIERWRGHIAQRLSEIEGRPMAEVLADSLVRERLTGGTGHLSGRDRVTVGQSRLADEEAEGRSMRARDNHERAIVRIATLLALGWLQHVPEGRRREFVRRFYRAGDAGLNAAVTRALCAAMEWERNADAADDAHFGLPKSVRWKIRQTLRDTAAAGVM